MHACMHIQTVIKFTNYIYYYQSMHLVYRAREGDITPMVLPPSLIPPSKRKVPPHLAGAVQVLPSLPSVTVASLTAVGGGRSTPTSKTDGLVPTVGC